MTNFSDAEIRRRVAWTMNRNELDRQLRSYIENEGHDTFVTLAINGGAKSMDYMRKILKDYMYQAEYALLRRKRSLGRVPASQRISGWFFAEHLDGNTHWHGIITTPKGMMTNSITYPFILASLTSRWEKCVPAGTAKYTPIADNLRGGVGYITKERWRTGFWETLVNLREFWPAK